MSRAPSLVVTGVRTGRSTVVDASSSSATVTPVATSAATSPPATAPSTAARRALGAFGGTGGSSGPPSRTGSSGSTARSRRRVRSRRRRARARPGLRSVRPRAATGRPARPAGSGWGRWARRTRWFPWSHLLPGPDECHRGGAGRSQEGFRVLGNQSASGAVVTGNTERQAPRMEHEHAWMARGLCVSIPPSTFFPSDGVGRRGGQEDLRRLPREERVPRARPREPDRPRRLGRLLRAGASSHPQAPPGGQARGGQLGDQAVGVGLSPSASSSSVACTPFLNSLCA